MTFKTLTAVAAAVCAVAALPGDGPSRSSGTASSPGTPSTTVSADARPSVATKGGLPLAFEANRGQIDDRARCFTRRGHVTTYFTDDAFVVSAEHRTDDEHVSGAALFLTFENCRPTPPRLLEPAAGIVNYFRGTDPSGWITDVPTYGRILYSGLYPGVDVEVKDGGGVPEYNLLLKPGASLDEVVVRVTGADSLKLDGDELVATTAKGELRQRIPRTWQIANGVTEDLRASFRLIDGERFGFAVEGRRADADLVVDPVLVFASYLGGAGLDEAHGVAAGEDGTVYVTGRTSSSDFPRSAGCYDNVKNGSYEAFVTKVSADGSALVYSTYLGSNGSDLGEEIAVDSAGFAYVSGWLGGSGFPTIAGSYDTSYNGFADTFVTKLALNGNSLVYSTFVGGSNEDRPNGLALCPDGGIVVVGQTLSTNFPTVAGSQDTSHNGNWDAFVTKLNAAGSALVYSTYLGGNVVDWAFGVAIAPDGAPIVTGGAQSATFPTVAGSYDVGHNGGFDVFVSKFNATGGTLGWSTFLGGAWTDQAMSIDVDPSGSAFVTGTCGFGFPSTPGAFDTANDGGEAFVTKLSPDGASLVYSTFLGGASTEQGSGIKVDGLGAAHICGFTNSAGFPITAATYDGSFAGGGSPAEGFVTKLGHDGSQLVFSTFVGSALNDECRAIALDPADNSFVVGITQGDYGAAAGSIDSSHNGAEDGFLLKLDLSPAALVQALAPGCNWAASPPLVGMTAPVLGANAVATGTDAPPGQLGVVLVGAVPASNSFYGFGCVLQMSTVVITQIADVLSASDGSWSSSAYVDPLPENAGAVVRVQAVFLSSAHPLGFVFSNGLEAVLGY